MKRIVKSNLHENKRSIDVWMELVDVIERNNSRPSLLAQKYFGNEVFNALNNLLNAINKNRQTEAKHISNLTKYELAEMVERVIREELEPIPFNRANRQDAIKGYENSEYKLVRFAYDDQGTNMIVLIDKQNKKIISYSITGKAEIAKFNSLSK